METMVHSDEVEKNAIAYKGHKVDGEERNPKQDVSPMPQQVKNPPAMQETQEMGVQSLVREDPLEEEMVTHSSILA